MLQLPIASYHTPLRCRHYTFFNEESGLSVWWFASLFICLRRTRNDIPNVENDDSYMENIDTNYKVPNLEKGLSVLEFLSGSLRGSTLQDIKNKLGLSQTTAYRILNTLVRLDYLVYDDETKSYRLSCKMLTLGFRALNDQQLLEVVLPHLRDLRDKVKETACFGVLGERNGIFIDQVRGHHAFSFTLTPGKTFELHCSAPGKAIMAYLPDNVRRRYLETMTFRKYNERTLVTREAYEEELDRVFRNGYALDNEEELSGVICIGAPVHNYKGYPCGAIWISGPKDRLPDGIVREYAEIVKQTARNISVELGYTGVR